MLIQELCAALRLQPRNGEDAQVVFRGVMLKTDIALIPFPVMTASYLRPAKAIELVSSTYISLPVNPESFIRREGLGIRRVSGEEYNGLDGKLDLEGRTVTLNSAMDDRQNREAAARLLGLYYADIQPETQALSEIERESYSAFFAAELLMPEKEVRKAWFDGLQEDEICAIFGVSPVMLDSRLKQIGIL